MEARILPFFVSFSAKIDSQFFLTKTICNYLLITKSLSTDFLSEQTDVKLHLYISDVGDRLALC